VASLKTIVNISPEVKVETDKWLKGLYSTALFTEEELAQVYETIKYNGFDRDEVLNQLRVTFPDPKLAAVVVIVCALRGPQAASKITLPNGKTLVQLGIPGSGGRGNKTLTCNKIAAATADLAAYYLKKLDVGKRIDSSLPGWLQFPTAGSIKLPDDIRSFHIDFSKKFSTLIGGVFNEQIYMTMRQNAYLDPNLNLF
jgi:hypothetical protein